MSALPRAAGAALAAAALAAAAAGRAEPGRRVRAVRVASKRLRSFWRLLKSSGGTRTGRRRRELSRAVGFLAAPREREALRSLAVELIRGDGKLAAPLSAFLHRLPPAPAPASLEHELDGASEALEASARALVRAARRARRSELRRGLKALKRRLRRARRRARRRGAPADLHACRKRAKDLRYALEALGASRGSLRDLRKAGRELGAARDLRALMKKARLRDARLQERAREDEADALARL